MMDEVLFRRGTTLVRRLTLEPGEATPWHRDPYHRVSVLLSGDALELQYQDGGESMHLDLTPGAVDWDEPCERVHRGVNVGTKVYEEVTTFFLDSPDAVAQPGMSPN